MIFHLLPQLAWLALQVVIAVALIAACGAAVFYPLRTLHRRGQPLPQWRVITRPGVETYHEYGYGVRTRKAANVVEVCLVRRGESLSIGKTKSSDDDFESALNKLITTAEDRAAALNATEGSLVR